MWKREPLSQRSPVAGQQNRRRDLQTLVVDQQRIDTQWRIRTKRKRGPLSQRLPVAFPRRCYRYVLWRVDRWISARCRTRVRVVEGRREAVSIGTYVPLLTAAAFYWALASYFHCDWLRPIQSAVCLQFVCDCMIGGVVVECEVCWYSSVARVISMWPVVTKAQVHLQPYNGVRNTHCYSFCRRDNWTIGFEWLLPAR